MWRKRAGNHGDTTSFDAITLDGCGYQQLLVSVGCCFQVK